MSKAIEFHIDADKTDFRNETLRGTLLDKIHGFALDHAVVQGCPSDAHEVELSYRVQEGVEFVDELVRLFEEHIEVKP